MKLSGEEFVKGFANKAGAVTALVLGVVAVAYALGIDPAEAVRRMLGMQLPSCPEPARPRFRARRQYATPLWLSERLPGRRHRRTPAGAATSPPARDAAPEPGPNPLTISHPASPSSQANTGSAAADPATESCA